MNSRFITLLVLFLLVPRGGAAQVLARFLEHQRVSGFVQADYVHSLESESQLNDANGEPLNLDRFLVRRARLKVTGSWTYLEYAVEADFNTLNGPQVGFRHLEAAIKLPSPGRRPYRPDALPLLRLGGGVFRSPFGYENYEQGDTTRLFADRALMSYAFIPGEFDVGMRLSGGLDWLRLTFAVQNGEPLGSRAFPGRDPNSAKDLFGRIAINPPAWRRIAVEAGFSAIWGRGFAPGSPPTKAAFVWRDYNEDGIVQLSELQGIPGAAAVPAKDFVRWGIEGDLRLRAQVPRLGEFVLYAEAAMAVNLDRGVRPANPVLLGRDQRERGVYAAVTQELTRYGMLGFRVDYYEPSLDATALLGGVVARSTERFYGYSFAGAFRYDELSFAKLRLVVDYTLKQQPIGRDASGRPANLRADVLTVRLQVEF